MSARGRVMLALLAAALAPAVFATPASGAARPLLPDLDQEVPTEIAVVEREAKTVLQFASATINVGSGPFVVEGRRAGEASVMRTWQVIVRSDSRRARQDLGNLLMYEYADTHEHWHLHAFARYELRLESNPGVVVRARKQGFCLGDRYDAFPKVRLPREPRRPVWTHDCGLGHTNARTMREGISPGFGDDYAPGLEGQYVNLKGVRAGRYLLVHRTNPAGLIREEDSTNNASSVLLELRRPAGRKPTVRVLRRCPDTLRCSAAES